MDSVFNKKQRKRIITRTGDRTFSNDLKRAGIDTAKSVIILGTCGQDSTDEKKQNSDSETIKTALATIAKSTCEEIKRLMS